MREEELVLLLDLHGGQRDTGIVLGLDAIRGLESIGEGDNKWKMLSDVVDKLRNTHFFLELGGNEGFVEKGVERAVVELNPVLLQLAVLVYGSCGRKKGNQCRNHDQ
mgnify:CR=1 FL=1